MGMFYKYDDLPSDYIPDNSSLKTVETYKIFEDASLVPVYSKKCELIGYALNEGDSAVLDTGLVIGIEVESDALIYTEANTYPDSYTQGYQGQRAYNIVDLKSYTCSGISGVSVQETLYTWDEDKDFTSPSSGLKNLEITPYANYNGAVARVLNFRGDTVLEFELSCIDRYITINKDTSNLLKQGVYYLEVYVFTKTERRQVRKHKLIVTNKDGGIV